MCSLQWCNRDQNQTMGPRPRPDQNLKAKITRPRSRAQVAQMSLFAFSRFDTVPACDRQTDRHTHTRLIPAHLQVKFQNANIIWTQLLLVKHQCGCTSANSLKYRFQVIWGTYLCWLRFHWNDARDTTKDCFFVFLEINIHAVTQGYGQCHLSIEHIRLPISVS